MVTIKDITKKEKLYQDAVFTELEGFDNAVPNEENEGTNAGTTSESIFDVLNDAKVIELKRLVADAILLSIKENIPLPFLEIELSPQSIARISSNIIDVAVISKNIFKGDWVTIDQVTNYLLDQSAILLNATLDFLEEKGVPIATEHLTALLNSLYEGSGDVLKIVVYQGVDVLGCFVKENVKGLLQKCSNWIRKKTGQFAKLQREKEITENYINN